MRATCARIRAQVPNPLYEYALSAKGQKCLAEMAPGAAVLAHGAVVVLLQDFLSLLVERGSSKERRIYLGMTPAGLALRLIEKRPLTFWLPQDSAVVTDGRRMSDSFRIAFRWG